MKKKPADNSPETRTDALIKFRFAVVVSADGFDRTLRMEAFVRVKNKKSKIKPGASSTDLDQQLVS